MRAVNTLEWSYSCFNLGHDEIPGPGHLSVGIYAVKSQDKRSIRFFDLTSVIDGVLERKWTLSDLGVKIFDFYFDIELDLLIIVEVLPSE